MVIKTERLILRPWEIKDAESLYQYAKDPDVGPMAGWPIHTSIENSRSIIQNVLRKKNTFAVCLKKDNVAIGSIGLLKPRITERDVKDTELEIGFWIGKPFWGHGYIPEAVYSIQKFAFIDLKCSGLWCGYYDGNTKSKRVQEKCGFTYSHTELDKECDLLNEHRTEHYMYLSREEWDATQK